jgi:hypothetical protein
MIDYLYAEIALSQAPRILGFSDRSNGSLTYGCFDRYYWHYRLMDVPNARFQEAVLFLGLLFKYEIPGNIYHGKMRILDWIQAGIDFWSRIRNRDGSLNEVYPYEHSFCATSFSTLAVTETLLLLKGKISPPILNKTADWLCRNENPDVANQMASSILALYNIYLLTGEESYWDVAERRVKELIHRQDSDGFFPEYGGYDIGYLSLTLSCLVKYSLRSGEEDLIPSLRRVIKFLEDRVEEDGSFDIKGTSRGTQYLYPYGLWVMGSEVAKRHLMGLRRKRVINPMWLDDRYVISLSIDYLETYLERDRC